MIAPSPAQDPGGAAAAAAGQLGRRTGVTGHDIAIVLGSGWLPASELLGEVAGECLTTDLHGFPPPAVPGHAGKIRSIRTPAGKRVLVFCGRTHYYEDLGVAAVVHGVRTAAAAGCSTVILTNSSGALDPAWIPGTPVLIRDHINLTGASPLRGPAFIDLTDLYSRRLRALVQQVEPGLAEGVYVQFRGPQYETPAEVRMARIVGGDLVGMSTALEAIAARATGMEVLGLSLVTNPAAGLTGAAIHHLDVLAAGAVAAARMGRLLAQVIVRL